MPLIVQAGAIANDVIDSTVANHGQGRGSAALKRRERRVGGRDERRIGRNDLGSP